jgi:hypothetical protein
MNVERLQESLQQRVSGVQSSIDSLAKALPNVLATFVSDAEKSPRLQTVRAARELLNAVGNAAGLSAIETLSNASIATSEAAMGQTLARARDLDETVRNLSEMFSLLRGIADERHKDAQQILSSVGEALASDEHAVSLKPRLKELERRAFALVQQAVASSPAPKPTVSARPGIRIVKEGREANLDRSSAVTLLHSIEAQIDETKRLSVSWTITQEEESK